MNLHDRIAIDNALKDSLSFKAIARKLNKDCTTISKEVRANISSRNSSSIGRTFNNCLHRHHCDLLAVCSTCHLKRPKLCRSCINCRSECLNFVEEVCPKLSKPPYVCNGCTDRIKCTLTKHFYFPIEANKKYMERLSVSRSGISINEEEIQHLNNLLVPLIKQQGQSIHHVFINHKDEIMMSEKTLYKLIDQCILDVRNIDLPRKIRYRLRKNKSTTYKIDTNCLDGRRYEDFEDYIKKHPEEAIVQMDTVEGVKGESCLLTIHFVTSSFMIAVKRECNNSKSVIDFFNYVYDALGKETFQRLFPILLVDNGSEFSNPKAIEFDAMGERRTRIFYCHPSAPYEKGSCEVNHELIRRIVPKGMTWNQYTQKDINLMMSHINSYARNKLNDKTPILLFNYLFDEEISSFFSITNIEADSINLTKKLIRK